MAVRVLPRLLAAALAALAALAVTTAAAQTPGEWQYEIRTDPSSIPAEARGNFPPSRFSQCRSAEDFASGIAFGPQAHPSSIERCALHDYQRSPAGRGVDRFQLRYSCDQGSNLKGEAEGRIEATRFSAVLITEHIPPADGVSRVRQHMTARRVGPCKTS